MFYTNTRSPVNLSETSSKCDQAPLEPCLDDPGVTTSTADRLRWFIDQVLESIDDPVDGEELARRVHLSRFHFDRLFAAALGETPAAFRRRLLLERAAWTLADSDDSITTVAFDAGYGSLEAFTHAFARSFGTSPGAYRASGRRDFRITASSGIHFHPPGGLLLPGDDSRRRTMTLSSFMLCHDRRHAAALIESAQALTSDALDRPVHVEPRTPAFASMSPTIREMLDRLVFTHEMWSAAIAGRAFAESADRSLEGMLARLAATDLVELVEGIASRGAWDTAFVDATCDPPESFTFGGAVAHALTWDAHRRLIATSALKAAGANPPPADPLYQEY
jgi:AraC family transcriptional regulator